MKRHLLTAAVLTMFLFSSFISAKSNSVKYSPAKPKPGDEISVTFNSAGTELAKAAKIDMAVSLFTDKIDEVITVALTKTGNAWTGKFKTNDKTEFASLIFSEGSKEEKNEGKGYLVKFFDAKGKELKGSLIGTVLSKTSWGTYTGEDRDIEGAVKGFNSLFKSYPELKDKYIVDYLTVLNRQDKEKAKVEIPAAIKAIESKQGVTEDEYSKVISLYSILKDSKGSTEAQKTMAAKFPTGRYAKSMKYSEISREKDAAKKAEKIAAFEKEYPNDPMINSIYASTFYTLTNESKFDEAKKIYDKYQIPSYYVSAFIDKAIKANKNLDLAMDMAKKVLESARTAMNAPVDKKPKTVSLKRWEDGKKQELGSALMTYANVLAATGKNAEALKSFEEGFALMPADEPDPEQTAKRINLTAAAGQNDKALKLAEEAISHNVVSEDIKAGYKKLFLAKNNNETAFKSQLDKLVAEGKKFMTEELKKKMLDKPAPKFTLMDLDGKKVSLDDFKGKIVIVDFWATWCGPCISSFPGMQKAVTKYAQDKNVQFLFLNTWQTEDDKKKNAADFIAKNKYTFHVLLDDMDKVVTSYKVSGIPTKFIIDKKGKIRFQSIGWGGDTDMLVEEISAMIELLK